ncbi:DNA excision repair protein Ercc1 [Haemaphysalis longicornis]
MANEADGPAEPTAKGRTNALVVSSRQKGNPLLKSLRSVPWEFGDIEPDYIVGQTTCALYLSLRYHQLFPNYIHGRLRSLGRAFDLRLLLVLVDVADPHPSLRELSQVSLLADCTLLLAWSAEEAGRHLETYKALEAKPADALMEKQDGDTASKLIDALSSVRSLTRPDAASLLASFGSLERLAGASEQELILQPGLGPHKARRLYEVLQQPFVRP